ncbi:hypothetical protein AgCh_031141 [Apium graveolens]
MIGSVSARPIRLGTEGGFPEKPWKVVDTRLALEDGSIWRAKSFGASSTQVGEVVFNTSLIGFDGGNEKQRRNGGTKLPHADEEQLHSMGNEDESIMRAHRIWDAIEPMDPKGDVDEKVDRVALAAVYQAILEDILLVVAEKTTAKRTWEAIKMMCHGAERVKTARTQTMKTEFETLRMKETEGIDEFSMTLSGLVTNIRALGETVEESYIVKKLLRAVPNRILQITSAMEQFGKIESNAKVG